MKDLAQKPLAVGDLVAYVVLKRKTPDMRVGRIAAIDGDTAVVEPVIYTGFNYSWSTGPRTVRRQGVELVHVEGVPAA